MSDKRTMTLNLSPEEMASVEEMAIFADVSKTALIKQAIRLYQLCQHRIRAGETMSFSGDKERIALFVGPGWEPKV